LAYRAARANCCHWTNKQIASELHLSEQTVKNHLRRMLRKVGAANRVAMVERCRYAAGL